MNKIKENKTISKKSKEVELIPINLSPKKGEKIIKAKVLSPSELAKLFDEQQKN